MLPSYYNHMRNFEDTMLTKFFGLHCVKSTGPVQKKVMFERYSTHQSSRVCDALRVDVDEFVFMIVFFRYLIISGSLHYHGKLVLLGVRLPQAI